MLTTEQVLLRSQVSAVRAEVGEPVQMQSLGRPHGTAGSARWQPPTETLQIHACRASSTHDTPDRGGGSTSMNQSQRSTEQ
ncbi:hypothetical protein D9V37_01260 [Nocardioides mangrovicus]|uniref:Uncharacterized protein n=1 Tax=Nocardioides mangrovicus TaxID=2478913 RepID=A0A3L8P876_9ACTN|nr:hypothetical protein D9V37_01260 [Nocardioides mangrovicus]